MVPDMHKKVNLPLFTEDWGHGTDLGTGRASRDNNCLQGSTYVLAWF